MVVEVEKAKWVVPRTFLRQRSGTCCPTEILLTVSKTNEFARNTTTATTTTATTTTTTARVVASVKHRQEYHTLIGWDKITKLQISLVLSAMPLKECQPMITIPNLFHSSLLYSTPLLIFEQKSPCQLPMVIFTELSLVTPLTGQKLPIKYM